MSQNSPRAIEEGNTPDGHCDSERLESVALAPGQPSQPYQGEPHYCDSSWQLYSMYSKIAQEEDKKVAERCQKGADATLIFAGLFLATVVTTLTVTFQDLRPNPQDTSAFYLENIYQLLASLNSSASISIALAKPPAFSPPKYVIWANSLLFLSAIFSIAAALVAILQQQWAQRYIMVTQQQSHVPDQRARIRAVFAGDSQGPDVMPRYGGISASVVPLHLHLSFFFFIAGGLIYLFNVNRAVFAAIMWLVAIGMIDYGLNTVNAIQKPDTLLYTPFTPLVFRLYLCILYAVSQVWPCATLLCHCRNGIKQHYQDLRDRYCEGFVQGQVKGAEEISLKKSSEIDIRILEWTFQSCLGGEDDTLEKFFKAVPGFFDSVVANLEGQLQDGFRDKLGHALRGFLHRTVSSDSVSKSVRSDRLVICLNAARAAQGSNGASRALNNILNGPWHETLQSGGAPNSAPSHLPTFGRQRSLATYPDVTATGAPAGNVTNISGVSDLANWIPLSTSGGGPAHHPVRETCTITSESSIVFGPKPIPNSMQVMSRDGIAVASLHFSIEPTISRADTIHHILEHPSSSSSSAAVLLPISEGHHYDLT